MSPISSARRSVTILLSNVTARTFSVGSVSLTGELTGAGTMRPSQTPGPPASACYPSIEKSVGATERLMRSPIAFRPPLKAQGDDLLEEVLVRHARLFGGVGEIFVLRDLRIGIRLQHIDLSVFIQP